MPAVESCYIYIRLPKELADGRPVLPEDPSPPHITMLYVGKVSRPTYWRIVERMHTWSWQADLAHHTIFVDPVVRFFELPDNFEIDGKQPSSNVAYAQIGDSGLLSLHHWLVERLVPDVVKKVKHINGVGGFTPHVTLQYLYGKQRTNKRILGKLDKLADAVSGSWELEMLHVDWGDIHRVAVTQSGTVYQER